MADYQVRRVELARGVVAFDTRTDRSVLGGFNQMRFMLDGRAAKADNVMLLNPLSVNCWLCHYPVSRGKDVWMGNGAMMERVTVL